MWNAIPKEFPSITFPVGAVIEDQKAVYKVLEPCAVDGFAHKYKCEVLRRKLPPPENLDIWGKMHFAQNIEWVLILKQNEHLISRVE